MLRNKSLACIFASLAIFVQSVNAAQPTAEQFLNQLREAQEIRWTILDPKMINTCKNDGQAFFHDGTVLEIMSPDTKSMLIVWTDKEDILINRTSVNPQFTAKPNSELDWRFVGWLRWYIEQRENTAMQNDRQYQLFDWTIWPWKTTQELNNNPRLARN